MHFSNERKTYRPDRKYIFSKSRQKAEEFNLGPLKDLNGLIDKVLALDSAKSYLRKQVQLITGQDSYRRFE